MAPRNREVVDVDVGAFAPPNQGRRKVQTVLNEQALARIHLEGPELQRAVPFGLRLIRHWITG